MSNSHEQSAREADVVARALERAHADLPPEGVTITAADKPTMREELLGVLLDDAEHLELPAENPERAA